MKNSETNIYSFNVLTLQGKELTMKDFEGKTILVVNTASKCGLTPQYEGLEALYQKYKEKGFVILGFPCNQFANQEPGNDSSLTENCLINYGVSFPMFAKVDVNGEAAHPLFKYLKKELPGLFGGSIKWNFTKFLIDADGKPLKRFAPISKPEKIDKYLQKILK
ncbi:glutathione peroxidase [Alkaliflexus imshenetskii]|uniref:glutathione peroxidase n=1 Tax=Alkaliflexus imshenetskii TaxID=286730 RepID=UPI0004B61978|nr:glutathione peroxidase [Alkaliflexus imshenetskii]